MSKPRIKDIRRAYVLDIIIRFEPQYETGIPQKRITKRVLIENINHKLSTKQIEKRYDLSYKDQKDEIKSKVNIAVSKTINSLERDGIITVTSPRVPGKRGANPNIISLNKSPKVLCKILSAYDEDLIRVPGMSSIFKHNLLISDYYKSLVNMELVNEVTSLSELPYTDEDKKLIYHLILSSPEALRRFLYEVYVYSGYITHKYESEALNELINHRFEKDGGGSIKSDFIDGLKVDFIKEVRESYDIPNFNIDININVKFKDENGKKVYEFSNEFEGAGDKSELIFPYFVFI